MPQSRTAPRPKPLLSSVVKVLTVSDAPDYEQPWQTQGPMSSSGSGAIVRTKRGLRVLTNAHVVSNQVFVEVRRYGTARKFIAEVEGVGHECDLALLHVPERSFFARAKPIEIAKLPQLSDRVAVCGYPIGGDRLSVTEGIVSRIEVASYAQSQRPLLAIQIDAAINSGNSGGPIFIGDKLAGIAFQSLEEGQNIAYAIAAPVVQHFLRDVERGILGFPDLGIWWQRLESEAHRQALGLQRRDGGVLLTQIAFEGSAWGKLREGDVLLQVGKTSVAADGTVPLREGELVDFSHLVSLHFTGDTLPIVVWREGKRVEVPIELRPPVYLVPEDRYDVPPTYYIFGGLLFVPLTRDYLKSWGSEWWKSAPNELVTQYELGCRTPGRQDVVVLQKVLADRINQGYHDWENAVVTHADDEPVRGLRDLIGIVESGKGPFVQFRTSGQRRIVLDRALAKTRVGEILDRYHVPADRSPDLAARPRRTARKASLGGRQLPQDAAVATRRKGG